MKTYLIDGTKDGKECSLELQASDETSCREQLKTEGIEITRLETNETHHLCKYCHKITNGTDLDELCDDCAKFFGHKLYSEL